MRVTDEGSPGTRYQGEISIKTGQREGAVLVKTPWFTLLLGTLNCILTSAGLQHLRRYVWTQVEKIIPLNGVFLSITIFETQPVFYHAICLVCWPLRPHSHSFFSQAKAHTTTPILTSSTKAEEDMSLDQHLYYPISDEHPFATYFGVLAVPGFWQPCKKLVMFQSLDHGTQF